jgi:hypothetical protein
LGWLERRHPLSRWGAWTAQWADRWARWGPVWGNSCALDALDGLGPDGPARSWGLGSAADWAFTDARLRGSRRAGRTAASSSALGVRSPFGLNLGGQGRTE